jgi:hypothetical protein
VHDKEPERCDPEAAAPAARRDVGQSGSMLTGYLAIGFGIAATFVWTFVATLDTPEESGAGVDLHISVLIGLIGTAIGACLGLSIEALRR